MPRGGLASIAQTQGHIQNKYIVRGGGELAKIHGDLNYLNKVLISKVYTVRPTIYTDFLTYAPQSIV